MVLPVSSGILAAINVVVALPTVVAILSEPFDCFRTLSVASGKLPTKPKLVALVWAFGGKVLKAAPFNKYQPLWLVVCIPCFISPGVKPALFVHSTLLLVDVNTWPAVPGKLLMSINLLFKSIFPFI